MKALIEIAIQVAIGVLAYFLLVWLAGIIGVPGQVIQIIAVLIFLVIAYRVYLIIKATPPTA